MVKKWIFVFGIYVIVATATLLGCSSRSPSDELHFATYGSYPVTVDYSLSLAEMVQLGHYKMANEYILEHKIIKGEPEGRGRRKVQLELVPFDGYMPTEEEVLAEMDKRRLRPATIAELLAFGAKYPDKQEEFWIIALGTVWQSPDGNCLFACLTSSDGGISLSESGRYLDVIQFTPSFHSCFCFLAVRK